MKKRFWIPSLIALVIAVTFFTGPKIKIPSYSRALPKLPDDPGQLEKWIKQKEAEAPVRKDNQARILWRNEIPQVTEYSIVYLHGFGGSYRDGYPVNVQVADSLGANLYLSRWAGHGLKPGTAMEDFSPDAAWESAKEALVIGQKIGKKVIIMSTSTGGTLAIKLAATYPDAVYALINLSPNIEDDIDAAWLLNSPWGYELAKLVSFGDKRKIEQESAEAAQYFDTVFPSRALVDLQVLVGTTMNKETFKQVKCPVLTLFYYENFLKEDDHVEVEVYPEVHKTFSTPPSKKKLVKLESPKTHFLGSEIKSKDTEVVLRSILNFLQDDLNIEIPKKEAANSVSLHSEGEQG